LLKTNLLGKIILAPATNYYLLITTMPVPAKRRSKSKGRRNRAHLALAKIKTIKCSKCGKPTSPHRVCPFCGSYKGKEIVKLKVKKKKKEKK
jgi:large subunit ribosomal protein L32